MNTKVSIKLVFLSTILIFFTSCLFYPKVSENQTANCKLITKNLTIDVMVDNNIYCQDIDCVWAALMLGPASAIVSGSIAIAGNTVYWIEEFGRCDESEIRSAITELNTSIHRTGGWIAANTSEFLDWFNRRTRTFRSISHVISRWSGYYNNNFHTSGKIVSLTLYSDGTLTGKWKTQKGSFVIGLDGTYKIDNYTITFEASGLLVLYNYEKTKVRVWGNGQINGEKANGQYQIDVENSRINDENGTWYITKRSF